MPERDYFLGMYLLRISHEREADINNLIGFAKYLKEQNVDDIVIDVYGTGDYLNEFLDKILITRLKIIFVIAAKLLIRKIR